MNHLYSDFKRRHKEHAEELEERVAIIQFDGNRKEETAENLAMMIIKNKYDLWGQND